jgi:amidase
VNKLNHPTTDCQDATTLAEELAQGQTTCRQLVQDALEKIEKLDRQGPCLHAVIEINPEALAIADKLDSERRQGKIRGPLHGIPILLKDNIATADQMRTTCGSLALEKFPAAADAHLVKLLRQQGLLILGKTNLSEWANFRSNRSSSGWSARGGLTRNPYCLDRSASGSSSGAAVVVAANYVSVSIGTETDGSIISPAQINGIVGLKPTVGLISRHGIIPISSSQDTAGPMTKTVKDAALLLEVLVGEDKADRATAGAPVRDKSYTSCLHLTGLKGARLGIVRELDVRPDVADIFSEAIEVMRAQGAVIIDPVVLPKRDDYSEAENEVLQTEFKVDVAEWLAEFAPQSGLSNLNEIIAWNVEKSKQELKFFAQETFDKSLMTEGLKSAKYLAAREKCLRLSRTEGIDKALSENQLDAIIAPSGDPAWLIDLVHGDRKVFIFGTAAAVAGLPHLTVPAGFVHGLPVGISFVGKAWSEGTLLNLGYAFEQATNARRPPSFLPTLKFDGASPS